MTTTVEMTVPARQSISLKTGQRYLIRVLCGRLCQTVRDGLTGQLIPGTPYRLFLANGEERLGKLDAESRLVEEGIPPGETRIHLIRPPKIGSVRLPVQLRERAFLEDLPPSFEMKSLGAFPSLCVRGEKIDFRAQVYAASALTRSVFEICDGKGRIVASLHASLISADGPSMTYQGHWTAGDGDPEPADYATYILAFSADMAGRRQRVESPVKISVVGDFML